jgi:hypothetical protein
MSSVLFFRQLNITDIHQMDVQSKEFLSLPKETQYELLTELTERRKQSSWGKMHEMPKSALGFSGFQMQRLISRQTVHKTLQNIGQEIGQQDSIVGTPMDPNLFVGDKEALKRAKIGMYRYAQSAYATIHSAITQPLATL